MNRLDTTVMLAITTTLIAIYLSVSTMDYRDAIEQENTDLKVQVKKLKAKVADPPKLCREHYLNQLKLKRKNNHMDAFQKYAHDSIVVLNKENFVRVVRQLNRIEALTVIRAAYGASLTSAKEILSYINLHTGKS